MCLVLEFLMDKIGNDSMQGGDSLLGKKELISGIPCLFPGPSSQAQQKDGV
jgi:hypothetical protein